MTTTPPVALVTGGAIRVGASIVTHLAAHGYRVWIHYFRSERQATDLATSLGSACAGTVKADLADQHARTGLIQTVTASGGPVGGRLDLLVNNAASFEHGAVLDRTDEDLRRVLELNLIAPVGLVRQLAPTLEHAGGSVVNVVDVAAYHPWRGYLDHCVAKAGLHMATRGLAAELAPLRVNGVAPGTVLWPEDPAYAEGSPARERIETAIPLGRIGRPEDVAATVLFLAQSPYVTGQVLAVDGGRLAACGRGYEREP